MADEKQEEMSMDEILSSIKNILSENGEPVAETQPAAETADIVSEPAETVPEAKDDVLDLESSDISVADLPFSEDDNNILDLTADMRVDAAAPEIDVEAEPTDGLDGEIDIDRELEDVPEVAADVPAVEPIELPAVEAEAEKTEILLPEVSVISDDIDSDPIYTPEDEASSQPCTKVMTVCRKKRRKFQLRPTLSILKCFRLPKPSRRRQNPKPAKQFRNQPCSLIGRRQKKQLFLLRGTMLKAAPMLPMFQPALLIILPRFLPAANRQRRHPNRQKFLLRSNWAKTQPCRIWSKPRFAT